MTTVRATIAQTPEPGRLEILDDRVITVGDDGRIVTVEPADRSTAVDVELGPDTVLLPGLVDTHVHAPQWPQLATGLDLPLETWLFEYTFPLEARYADIDFARRVWSSLVPSLLAAGTTTAVYYSSIHEPATVALAEACITHGQRAFVGRVAMDHPEGTPDWYRDPSPTAAVDASHRSLQAIAAASGDLVRPVITPRFAPACTDALLTGLGELAETTGAAVQTHCSESDWQHSYAFDRFGCSDTDALDRFGLLRDHGVLAHAVHLSDDDRHLLLARGAGVAHCPLSNTYFGDGVFPARRSIDQGLRVGLGTDIAGGPDAAVLANCAHAVASSRMLERGVDPAVAPGRRGRVGSAVDVATAFWMATVGGADLLGIPVGLLEPGRAFDAVAVDIGPGSSIGIWPELDDWPRIFETLVRRAGPSDITSVWVDGRTVTPRHGQDPIQRTGSTPS